MSALPFCHLSRTARPKLHSAYWRLVNRYPENPEAIGQHIRKRRLDLGLLQRQIGKSLGVGAETIRNWERGKYDPPVRAFPTIFHFLGYDPFPKPIILADKIIHLRKVRDCIAPRRALQRQAFDRPGSVAAPESIRP